VRGCRGAWVQGHLLHGDLGLLAVELLLQRLLEEHRHPGSGILILRGGTLGQGISASTECDPDHCPQQWLPHLKSPRMMSIALPGPRAVCASNCCRTPRPPAGAAQVSYASRKAYMRPRSGAAPGSACL